MSESVMSLYLESDEFSVSGAVVVAGRTWDYETDRFTDNGFFTPQPAHQGYGLVRFVLYIVAPLKHVYNMKFQSSNREMTVYVAFEYEIGNM